MTKEIIACLKEYFHYFGIYRRIISDRHSFFVSDEFTYYLKQLNIEYIKVVTAIST